MALPQQTNPSVNPKNSIGVSSIKRQWKASQAFQEQKQQSQQQKQTTAPDVPHPQAPASEASSSQTLATTPEPWRSWEDQATDAYVRGYNDALADMDDVWYDSQLDEAAAAEGYAPHRGRSDCAHSGGDWDDDSVSEFEDDWENDDEEFIGRSMKSEDSRSPASLCFSKQRQT